MSLEYWGHLGFKPKPKDLLTAVFMVFFSPRQILDHGHILANSVTIWH
jgi:hypothetical protein